MAEQANTDGWSVIPTTGARCAHAAEAGPLPESAACTAAPHCDCRSHIMLLRSESFASGETQPLLRDEGDAHKARQLYGAGFRRLRLAKGIDDHEFARSMVYVLVASCAGHIPLSTSRVEDGVPQLYVADFTG